MVRTDRARRARRKGLPLLVLLTVALAGCAQDAPLDTMEPSGPAARTIDGLFNLVMGIGGVVFVLIFGALLVIMVKFRASDDDDEFPNQTHGNTALEIVWTIFPSAVLAGLAVFTVATIFDLEERDPDAIPVTIIGQQWWWEYQYDVDGDGSPDIITANDLVMPAGRQLDLTIQSRDVIHSWWIPKLNGKRDAVPGRSHTWSIEADDPGIFLGQCTEFCGLSHARMQMRAVALSQEDWETWLDNQLQQAEHPSDPSAQSGKDTFSELCASCHVINDPDFADLYPSDFRAAQVSGAAPNLTHFATRGVYAGAVFDLYFDEVTADNYLEIANSLERDRGQLEAWLRNPPAEKEMFPDASRGTELGRGMPNLNLTNEQVDDLLAYLATLD
ncbi:MAG: cytochrome c oxidase subunit II [Actinomycetia bacterium]|nr:cytochrome c oxidase subunit II [Actinomycetes bacterium]